MEGAGGLRVRGRCHSTVGCHGGPAERLVSCVRARRRLVAWADSWESRSLGCSGGGGGTGGGRKDTHDCTIDSRHVIPTPGITGTLQAMWNYFTTTPGAQRSVSGHPCSGKTSYAKHDGVFSTSTGAVVVERLDCSSRVGIVPEDAAGRRVSAGISRFLCTCMPALLHIRLVSHLIGSQDLVVNATTWLELRNFPPVSPRRMRSSNHVRLTGRPPEDDQQHLQQHK
ncbi:hypothetical protein PR048_030181 [Dryococelus australis]|uniref:Uncharacterized protein n=1 Tax=Dryococelus australis TaxID=614101 RepID=A0ABQ9G873_9NEOP|nr:hypothetical protein PR048_030181 [Dryococelus australis]